jgi:hypothetical protein
MITRRGLLLAAVAGLAGAPCAASRPSASWSREAT